MTESIHAPHMRNSSIELLRIAAMFAITATHYVGHSDLFVLMSKASVLTPNIIFLYILRGLGTAGTNCFLLIMGYFMCTSSMTARKFLRLFLEILFYRAVIHVIVYLCGKETLTHCIWQILPFDRIGSWFIGSIIPFFLFIPYLNMLIRAMDKKMHSRLLLLCVALFSLLPTLGIHVKFGDFAWFSTLYVTGAWLRLYPPKPMGQLFRALLAIVSLCLLCGSVILLAYLGRHNILRITSFYFSYPRSQLLPFIASLCIFNFFRGMHPFYNRFINAVAASAFGVLLMHINNDPWTMKAIWDELLHCSEYFASPFPLLVQHTLIAVTMVYFVCTFIDMLRRQLLEKPLFDLYDRLRSHR